MSTERVPFIIGQRVLIRSGKEIATVLSSRDKRDDSLVWVRTVDGIECWFAYDNVHPLPGGQL